MLMESTQVPLCDFDVLPIAGLDNSKEYKVWGKINHRQILLLLAEASMMNTNRIVLRILLLLAEASTMNTNRIVFDVQKKIFSLQLDREIVHFNSLLNSRTIFKQENVLLISLKSAHTTNLLNDPINLNA
jgi:hypothetical protein